MKSPGTTELLRAAWGTVLVSQPRRALALRDTARLSGLAVFAARLLGARQLTQAAITALAPTPRVIRFGAAVDTLHACTGIGLAVLVPRWRRTALADAAVAAGFAVGGQLRVRPPGHRHALGWLVPVAARKNTASSSPSMSTDSSRNRPFTPARTTRRGPHWPP
ncbi:MAG TPA: hypothetical protein VIJ96_12005 [Acidothermaceae bacterium]